MATCSECTYLNLDKERDKDGKFWCEAKYEWFYADCAECWRFCKAYSRSKQKADSFKDYSTNKQNSDGCFITTMLCEILNLEDNNFYLQALRMFRNKYLQKNPNTIHILEEYDFVGPLIAKSLRNDQNNIIVAHECFKNYIIPISNDLCLNNFNNAINKYMDMTEVLMNMYQLDIFKHTIPGINQFDYNKDYSNYGHGRQLKK